MNQSAVETEKSLSRLVAPKTTFTPALLGSVLAWLAFPPVGWGSLAWFAPIPWLLLVQQRHLSGKSPYFALWFAGFVFWLLGVHWIRLPHPLNYLALIALASYLGCYLPLFVALSRVGVHRLRVPLWLAVPVVWTGLDWLRGHLMTGFLMASLAHTQIEYPAVIQIADILGEYGVTFLIMLVAASLTGFLWDAFSANRSPVSQLLRLALRLLPGGVALLAAIAYGLSQIPENAAKPQATVRIALIQGNTLADWKGDLEKQEQIMAEYLGLSIDAVQQSREIDGREVDLVIWPETSFRQTLVAVEDGYRPPQERVHESMLTASQRDLAELVLQLGTAALVGVDRMYLFPDSAGDLDFNSYNSAVLVDIQGNVLDVYDKMHRVPFGEYIPFAEWIPALYRLTPLTGGIQAGSQPATLRLGDVLLSPNICYETAVPHLIRQQVQDTIDTEHARPTALVNLTNDAWYWGSSELDMHLACGVFRAVEMRTPLLIAANGGLSAHVDATGRVLQATKRQQTATLLVDLPLQDAGTGYPSFYAKWGDWFAVACVLNCMVLAVLSRVATQRTAHSGDLSDRG